MSRAAWAGIFCFGMVNVPCELVASDELTNSPELDRLASVFDEIRERNKPKRAFKIHQFMQQQHFLKSLADLSSVPVPAKHVLQVHGFIAEGEFDAAYYDKSLYLIPNAGAEEPIVTMSDALSENGVIGFGSLRIDEKPTLCAVRYIKGAVKVDLLKKTAEIEKISSSNVKKALKDAIQSFEGDVEAAQPTV